jgi:hypothetical protein
MNFKRSCEESLWESQYNRDANGKFYDPDTGLPIPDGAGLKAQIQQRNL